MQLYCPLLDTQITGDLLVELSPHNMGKHLQFALGQHLEEDAYLRLPFACCAFPWIAAKRASRRPTTFLLERAFPGNTPHHCASLAQSREYLRARSKENR